MTCQGSNINQKFSPGSSVGKESACNAGNPDWFPGSGRSAGEGIGDPLQYSWASLVAKLVKNPPAMQEMWVQSLGWEDPLEQGKATNSSILPWRIPLTVYSMGSQRVGHNWATFTSLHKELDTHWVTEPPLQVTYLTTLCPSLLIYYICIMSFVWYTTNAHHVTYLLSPQLSIVHL